MLEYETRSKDLMQTSGSTAVANTAADGRRLLVVATICGLLALAGVRISGFGTLLPLVAASLVSSGFAIAAIAWITGARRSEKDLTSWDVAGVLAFLGFAAAMISA